MIAGRSRLAAFLLALAAALALPATGAAARASLTDIENDVMCVACHESLAVAQSPQAQSERDFVRGLIAQGQTKPQIERQLVAQYGAAVLAKPPAHGFNLTVYVLPPALLLLGLVTLAVVLPRWRRRARPAAAHPAAASASPTAAEETRLQEDLSRFGG
jgi:cytochrome c-type biogenesis protein CcmH